MSSATCCGISSMRSIVYHRCNASYIIKAQAIMHADAWWDTVPKGLMISRSCGTGWYTKPTAAWIQKKNFWKSKVLFLELVMWLEHTTCWLRISCTTDCATPAYWILTTYLLYPILSLLSISFYKKGEHFFFLFPPLLILAQMCGRMIGESASCKKEETILW